LDIASEETTARQISILEIERNEDTALIVKPSFLRSLISLL
jgi:hypothetical protein